MLRLGALVVLLAAVLLAGCTVPVAGTASPPAPITLPPRPRDIHLAGIDPCTLLTEAQRAELRLDQLPVLDTSPSTAHGGAAVPLCSIRGAVRPFIAAGVSVSTGSGIESWTSDRVRVARIPITVMGFPAIKMESSRQAPLNACLIVVDVADREALEIQVTDGGNEPQIPTGELCETSGRVADLAMASLLML